VRYFNKKASIAIFTTGYWRSYFFQKLFSNCAKMSLYNYKKESIYPKNVKADYILWEKQLPFCPYDHFDENKVFIFDYEDGGDRDKLIEAAIKWKIKRPRFLLLFPKKEHDDTGCLPLPPPAKLQKQYFFSPKKLRDRKHDTFFMCAPTYIHISKSELQNKKDLPYFTKIEERKEYFYNQRLEWVEKLKYGGLLRIGNGIIRSNHDYLKEDIILKQFKFKKDIFVPPISKKTFTHNLLNSKIVFSPGGHSRWAYRHVESMFNRALTISADISDRKSLPKLPHDAFLMIPDGKFNVKKIQSILDSIESFQEKAEIGFEFAKSTYKERTFLHRERFRKNKVKEMFNNLTNWLEANLQR